MSFTHRCLHYACIRRKRWWRLPVCLSECLRKGDGGERDASISLTSSCGAMISLISAQLWSLSGSQVARALKKTDRKRGAAREEGQLEIGARVAQHVRMGERENCREGRADERA